MNASASQRSLTDSLEVLLPTSSQVLLKESAAAASSSSAAPRPPVQPRPPAATRPVHRPRPRGAGSMAASDGSKAGIALSAGEPLNVQLDAECRALSANTQEDESEKSDREYRYEYLCALYEALLAQQAGNRSELTAFRQFAKLGVDLESQAALDVVYQELLRMRNGEGEESRAPSVSPSENHMGPLFSMLKEFPQGQDDRELETSKQFVEEGRELEASKPRCDAFSEKELQHPLDSSQELASTLDKQQAPSEEQKGDVDVKGQAVLSEMQTTEVQQELASTQELCRTLKATELQQQLASSEELCRTLKQQLVSSAKQNEDFMGRLVLTEGQASELQQQLTSSQELCSSLTQQLASSEAQNIDFKGRLALSEENAAELQQQLFVKEGQCLELKGQPAASGACGDSEAVFNQQLASGNELCTTLKQQLASAAEQNAELLKRLALSEEQAAELQQQLFVSEGQRLELKNRLAADGSNLNNASLEELEAERAAAVASCKQLSTECADLRLQLESSRQCREEESQHWQACEKKLQDDREELKCQLAELERRRVEEEECWRSRWKEMESKTLEQPGRAEDNLSQVLAELEDTKRHNESLQTLLATSECRCGLAAALEDMRRERDKLKTQLAVAEGQIQALRDFQLEDSQRRERLAGELQMTKQRAEEMPSGLVKQEDIESLKSQLAKTSKQLDEARTELAQAGQRQAESENVLRAELEAARLQLSEAKKRFSEKGAIGSKEEECIRLQPEEGKRQHEEAKHDETYRLSQDTMHALRKDMEDAEQTPHTIEFMLKTEAEDCRTELKTAFQKSADFEKAAHAQLQDLRRERDAMQAQLEAVKQANERMGKAQENLLAELDAARLKASETCLRLLVHEETFKLSTDTIAALRADLAEAEQIRDAMDKALKAEVEEARQQLKKAAEHLQEQHGQDDASNLQRMQSLQERLQNDVASRDTKLLALQQQCKEAAEQLGARSSELERLQAEMNLMKSKHETQTERDAMSSREREDELQTLRQQHEQVAHESERLQKELEEMKAKQGVQREVACICSRVALAACLRQQLDQDLAQQGTNAAQLQKKLESLRQQSDEDARVSRERDDELQALRQQHERVASEADRFQKELEEIKAKHGVEREVASTCSRVVLAACFAQQQEATRQLSERSAELDGVKAELNFIKNKSDAADSRDLHKEYAEMASARARNEREARDLAAQVESLNRSLAQSNHDSGQLRQKLREAQENHGKQIESMLKAHADREAELQVAQRRCKLDAKEKLHALETQLAVHDAHLNNGSEELQRLQRDAAAREKAYLSLQQQHQGAMQQLSERSAELDIVKAEMLKAQSNRDTELQLAMQQCESHLKDKVHALETELAVSNAHLKDAEQLRESLQNDAATRERELANLQQQHMQATQQLSARCVELDCLRAELNFMKSKYGAEAEEDLQEHREKYAEITAVCLEHERRASDLAAQVARISESLMERDSELAQLRKDMTEAQKEHSSKTESLLKAHGERDTELQLALRQCELAAKEKLHALETELAVSNAHLMDSSKVAGVPCGSAAEERAYLSLQQQHQQVTEQLAESLSEQNCLESRIFDLKGKYGAQLKQVRQQFAQSLGEQDCLMDRIFELHSKYGAQLDEDLRERSKREAEITTVSVSLAERDSTVAQLRRDLTDTREEHGKHLEEMLKREFNRDAELYLARLHHEKDAEEKIHALETQLSVSNAHLSDSNEAVGRLEEQLQSNKAELEFLKGKYGAQLEEDSREFRERDAENAAARARNEQEKKDLEAKTKDLAVKVASLSETLAERGEELERSSQALVEARKKHVEMELMLKARDSRNDKVNCEQDAKERIHTLEIQLAASTAQLNDSSEEVTRLREQLHCDEETRERGYQNLQERHKETTQQLADTGEELERLKAEMNFMKTKYDAKCEEILRDGHQKDAESATAKNRQEGEARVWAAKVDDLARQLQERNDELEGVRRDLAESRERYMQMESKMQSQGSRDIEIAAAQSRQEKEAQDWAAKADDMSKQLLERNVELEGVRRDLAEAKEKLMQVHSKLPLQDDRVTERQLPQLQDDQNSKSQQLADKSVELESLKAELNFIKGKYDAKCEEELQKHHGKDAEMAAVRTCHEEEAKDWAAKVDSLRRQLTERNDELEGVRRDLAEARDKHMQIESALKLQGRRDIENQDQENIRALETELAMSKASLKDSVEEVQRLREQLQGDAATRENGWLRLQQQHKEALQQVADRSDELERVKADLKSMRGKYDARCEEDVRNRQEKDAELAAARTRHEEETKDWAAKVEGLSKSLTERNDEMERLRRDLTEAREIDMKSQGGKDTAVQLAQQQSAQDAKEKIHALETQLAVSNAHLQDSSEELQRLREQLQGDAATRESAYLSMQQQLRQTSQQLAERSEELERLRAELNIMKDKYDTKCEKEVREHHKRDAEIAAARARHEEEVKELAAKVASLNGTLTERNDELERLRRELTESRDKFFNQWESLLKSQGDRDTQLQLVRQQFEQEAKNLTETVTSLKAALAERSAELDCLRQELRDAKTKLSALQEESICFRVEKEAELSVQQRSHEQELKISATQIASLRDTLALRSEELERLRGELKEARNSFSTKFEEAMKVKTDKDLELATARMHHNEEAGALATQVASLSKALAEKDETVQLCRGELKDMQQSCTAHMDVGLSDRRDLQAQLAADRRKHAKDAEEWALRVAGLNQSLAGRNSDMEKLRAELDSVMCKAEQDLMELDKQLEGMKCQKDDSESQLENARKQCQEQEAAIQGRNSELVANEGELRKLQGALMTAHQDKSAAEEKLALLGKGVNESERRLAEQEAEAKEGLAGCEKRIAELRTQLEVQRVQADAADAKAVRNAEQEAEAQGRIGACEESVAGLRTQLEVQRVEAAEMQALAKAEMEAKAVQHEAEVAKAFTAKAEVESRNRELLSALDTAKVTGDARTSQLEQKDAVRAALEAQMKSQMSEAFAAISATNSASEMSSAKAAKREQQLEAMLESEKASLADANKSLSHAKSSAQDLANRLQHTETESANTAKAAQKKVACHIEEANEAAAARRAAEALSADLRKRADELASALEAEKSNAADALATTHAQVASLQQRTSELERQEREQAANDAARIAASLAHSEVQAAELHDHREKAAQAAADRSVVEGTVSDLQDEVAGLERALSAQESEAREAAVLAEAAANHHMAEIAYEAKLLATERSSSEVRCAGLEEATASLWMELSAAESRCACLEASAAKMLSAEQSSSELRCAGLEEATASLWMEFSEAEARSAGLDQNSGHWTDRGITSSLATLKSQVAALQKYASDLEAELENERRARALLDGRQSALPELRSESQRERRSQVSTPGIEPLPPPRPQTALEMQQSARGSTPSVERPPRPHTVTEERAGGHQFSASHFSPQLEHSHSPRHIDVKQFAGADGRCPACKKVFGSRRRLIKHLLDESKPVCKHFCRCHVKPLTAYQVAALDELDRAARNKSRCSSGEPGRDRNLDNSLTNRDAGLSGSLASRLDDSVSLGGTLTKDEEDQFTPRTPTPRSHSSLIANSASSPRTTRKLRSTLPKDMFAHADGNNGGHVGLQQIWKPMF